MALHAHVAGWGMYAPAQRLTNIDLAARMDTSDEWIRSRTGIVERRLAGERETTASMAIQAGRQALQRANLSPVALDAIIVATITGDYPFPATACLVQAGLGAEKAAAFDVSAGCTGFIYALAIGRMGIVSGQWKHVLVIGAETLSRFTDWQDRNTCVLFGDGAGALLLLGSEEPGGVLETVLGADGSGADLLMIPAGGSLHPPCTETVAARQHFLQMDGSAVFRFASQILPAAVAQVLQKAGLSLDQIDLIIPHQANIRIIEAARKRLGVPEETIFVNLERYGNTSAASIPIALCEAVESELINDGCHLVLVGFGAGLTWGAAVLRWGVPLPAQPQTWWQSQFQRLRFVVVRLPMALRRLFYHVIRHIPFWKD